MLSEADSLGREVDADLCNRMSQSSLLTVDDILGITSAVDASSLNSIDLLIEQGAEVSNDYLQVIDAFRKHIFKMFYFLYFSVQSGVELENVLIHIKPIAIHAARVFITDFASNWRRDVESYCLAVNAMAVDPQVYQACSQALAAASTSLVMAAPTPHVDHHVLQGFLDSLISLLWDVLRLSQSDSRYKHHFKVLYEGLRSTRTIVRNCEDEKVLGQIGVLTCEAGVFIYSHHQTDPERLSDLLQRFDVLRAQVKPNDDEDDGARKDLDVLAPNWNHQTPQSSTTSVDFHPDEVTSILDRLTRGSKQLCIVQISGMAGIGKTTFVGTAELTTAHISMILSALGQVRTILILG